MAASSGRATAERKHDAIAVLERNGDAFLSSASPDGKPHLIVVATWWNGSEIVMATVAGTRTASQPFRRCDRAAGLWHLE